MIEMDEIYRTGLEEIDAEHVVLLDLTDKARKLLEDENMLFKNDDISRILKGLHDYTVQHFDHEEEYMTSIGFDGLETQKAQHQVFREKLNQFMEEVNKVSLGTQDDMLRELFGYLEKWLHDHIKIEDMKYAKFAGTKA